MTGILMCLAWCYQASARISIDFYVTLFASVLISNLVSFLSVFAIKDHIYVTQFLFLLFMNKMPLNKTVQYLLVLFLHAALSRPCSVSFFTMPFFFFLSVGCSACGRCPQFRWGLHSCPDVTVVGQRRALVEGG